MIKRKNVEVAKPHSLPKAVLKNRSVALALCFLALASVSVAIHAGPWVEVGDEQTRHHLSYLRDTGAIQIPLGTWPLPWADIAREVRDIEFNELNQAQLWSLRYIKHALNQAERARSSRKRLYAGNSLVPFTNFGSDAREDAFIASENNFMGEHFVLNLAAKAVHTPIGDDDDYQFDGSYLAAVAGNWILGVGAIDRWWGPGWQSSLILSNSARPGPGIFLRRKEALGFDIPVLKLIGRWSIDIFAERLIDDGELNDKDFFGTRLAMMPTDRLELGLSGTVLAGREYQQKVLLGDTTPPSPGPLLAPPIKDGETRRQFSYDARVRILPELAVYGQLMTSKGKEISGETRATLMGLEGTLFALGIHSRFMLEISDTSLDGASSIAATNEDLRRVALDEAYRYKLRSLGETAGYLHRKLSFAGEHFFPNGHQLSWRIAEIKPIGDLSSARVIRNQGLGELIYHAPINETLKASVGVFILKNNFMLGTQEVESGAHLQLDFRF